MNSFPEDKTPQNCPTGARKGIKFKMEKVELKKLSEKMEQLARDTKSIEQKTGCNGYSEFEQLNQWNVAVCKVYQEAGEIMQKLRESYRKFLEFEAERIQEELKKLDE